MGVSDGGLFHIDPGDIIHPVVIVLTLTWCIRYSYLFIDDFILFLNDLKTVPTERYFSSHVFLIFIININK